MSRSHGPARDGRVWRAELPIATALVLVQVILSAVEVGLGELGRAYRPFSDSTLLVDVAGAAGTLAYAVTGLVIVARRPGNRIGWLFVLANLPWAVNNLASAWVEFSTVAAPLPATAAAAWLATWPGALSLTCYMLLAILFPDGRAVTTRWRRFAWFVVAVGVIQAVTAAFAAGPIESLQLDGLDVRNPLALGGAAGDLFAGLGNGLLQLASVALFAVAAMGMVIRLRGSAGVERQQLKWLALAVAATGALWISNVPAMMLYASFEDMPSWVRAWNVVSTNGGVLIPIAAAIAILRYRLYDIDRIVSRTVGWTAVTVTLVAVFAAFVVGLEDVLAGVTQDQTVAVAASTLAVFALFQPLRRRVQAVVDRRFDRARYDGQRAVDAFAERLRGEVDLVAIGEEMLGVVGSTVRPRNGSIWLRGGTR